MKTEQEIINFLLIETAVIKPLRDIVEKLKTSSPDLRFMEGDYDRFIGLAAQLLCPKLDYSFERTKERNDRRVKDNGRTYYLERFEKLLAFFSKITESE